MGKKYCLNPICLSAVGTKGSLLNYTSHCRHNYGNAIYPKAYEGAVEDEELLYLATYLLTLQGLENVRRVEKRNWRFG